MGGKKKRINFHFTTGTHIRGWYIFNKRWMSAPWLQMFYTATRKHKCSHLPPAHNRATERNKKTRRNSLDGPFQWSPSPSSCLPVSLFLHQRRWCLCQAGAQRPHKAREDVTTNKNSIVTPRNLIRSHWFMLWMETEYLESGSSNKAIDSMTGAFTIQLCSSLSFCSHL